MKRLALLVTSLLFLAPGAASASIIVGVPDADILSDAVSASLTLTVEFEGSYDVDSYELTVLLSGRDGATGLTFDGAAAAAVDYVFMDSVGWSTVTDEDYLIYGDDGASSGPETLADTTKNMITVNLVLDSVTVGDIFDVTIDPSGSAIYDRDYQEFNVIWDGGVITIIPEPMSVSLLLFGGLAALARRRR